MNKTERYTRIIISFSEYFPDERILSIAEYIKDIPSKQSLEIISHFSAQLHTNDHNQEVHLKILRQWLGRQSESLKKRISKISAAHIRKNNFQFLNQPACLNLIQEIIINNNNFERRELTALDELNLFKAYLVSSQWIVDKFEHISDANLSNTSDFVKLTLETQLPISDLKASREFYIQAYKAIIFFNFCAENDGFRDVANDFIASKKLSSWQEYLISILHIYTRHLLKQGEENKSWLNTDTPEHVDDFLRTLSLDISKYEPKPDFISIRENPIYNIDHKAFLFLNIDLFLDKIFDGILFDIYSSTSENKYTGINNSCFLNFKSMIGDIFTEEILLNEIIDYIKSPDWKVLAGKNLKKSISGSPDFYIRRKSKVFIIECKDTLISSNMKNSSNIEVISDEIERKLTVGENDKPKGVAQILSFIQKINDHDINEIDNIDPSLCKFYPILVVTDICLNEYGVNFLINTLNPQAIYKKSQKSG